MTAAVLAALYAAPSLSADADHDDSQLQDIVVTATRHAESAQDIPLSITAVSGASLEAAGIQDIAGLARSLSGVTYADKGPFGSVSGSTLIIRGLNSLKTDQLALAPSIVPAVATYVDETPLFVNLRLVDLERVEILRGPQGTLYGSGSLGGTIRFVQNAPDPSGFDAKVITGFSETSHAKGTNYDVTGVLNLPLSSTFAVRLNASYTYDAGFIDQPNLYRLGSNGVPLAAQPGNVLSAPVVYGEDGVNSYDYKSARLAALWQPTDAFRAELSYYYQLSTADGYPYDSPVQYGAQSLDSAALALEPTHDKVDLSALTLSYDVGFATLTSATSWYEHTNQTVSDLTALYQHFSFYTAYYGSNPRALFQGNDDFDDKAWSEEVRLASKTGGAFDWVAGIFYRHQIRDINDHESYPGYSDFYNACAPVYGADSSQCGIGEIAYPNNRVNGVAVTPDLVYLGDIQSSFQDAALFGDLTWHVTSAWSVTGGARVFKQTQDQTQQVGALLFGPTFVTDNTLSDTLRRALFKANTAYKLNDTNLVYATWSQGFRQGGVNALPVSLKGFGPTNPQLFRFQPDFADNSELGVKGTLFNRLRYAAAIFDIEWKNIQEEEPVTALAFPSPINVGNGYSRGLESEFEASLNEHLLARLGYTYDKAVLQSLSEVASVALTTPPVVGRQLPGTPLQSLAAGLEYSTGRIAGFRMTYDVDGHYQSAIVSQTTATTVTAGGFTTWNARASATRDQWRASVFVNNLTNVLGIDSYTDRASYGNRYFGLVSQPRTIGLSVEYSFKGF